MTSPLPFAKMHGAGNDFVVLTGAPPPAPRDAELVRALCHRRLGIGADGALWMQPLPDDPEAHFRMHFYNGDGGRVNLCLNGARCVARRAVDLGWSEGEVVFRTERNLVRATVGDGGVTLRLTEPPGPAKTVGLPEWAPGERGWGVHTGDPHLVVEVDGPTLEAPDFEARARPLRHWTDAFPHGTNVHFVHRAEPSTWDIRSFERGVEGETLACGSGCVSAVRAMGGEKAVRLRTSTGAVLTVDPREDPWTLHGPAVTVYEGGFRGEAA